MGWGKVRPQRVATSIAFLGVLVVGGLVRGGDAPAEDPPPRVVWVERFERELDVTAFQKGNLHAHSARSDGDSTPEQVYRWYRRHGYRFAVVSDHNLRVDPRPYAFLERRDFAILPAEEVTLTIGGKPVHVNGICTERQVGGDDFDDVHIGLSWATSQIRAAGGVALVNHPNFGSALDVEGIAAVEGVGLLELMSGHALVPWRGDETRPPHEAIWQELLDRGLDVAPAAVDDAHRFAERSQAPPARPGAGWVATFGGETTREAICGALARGELYASSGPVIKRLRVTADRLEVWPKRWYARVEFVGAKGVLLGTGTPDEEGRVVYQLRGGEGLVRARVLGAADSVAWTPAFRVERTPGP